MWLSILLDDEERSSMRRHLYRNDAVGVSATNKGFYDASGAPNIGISRLIRNLESY